MFRFFRRVVALLILVGAGGGGAAIAQDHGFEQLLHATPPGANALVMINVEKALESPVARERKWKDKLSEAFQSGVVTLPPNATRFVQAAQLDIETMSPAWEATVVELRTAPDFDRIVREHDATVDEIGGHRAAAFRNDMYLVQFGPKVLGMMQPANRQQVARWVRQVDQQKESSLSPYLHEAANYAEFKGTEAILAIDLTDVVSAEFAERRLNEADAVREAKADVAALAQTASGLRGVMLGIVFDKQPHAKLKVDFTGSTAAIGTLGKPLLLAALKNHGVMVDDFEKWKPGHKEKQISLEGNLSPEGMRRVMTLIVGPTTPVEKAATAPAPTASGAEESLARLKKEATQSYVKGVNTLVSDIASRKDAKTLAQYGVWLTQYARKIEAMSAGGVDEEAAKFGLYAAESLRKAGAAVRGIGIQSAAREAQVYPEPEVAGYNRSGVGWNPAYGWGRSYGVDYGFYYHDRNIEGERRAIRKDERAKGMTNAFQILDQLESDMAQLRQRMEAKYP